MSWRQITFLENTLAIDWAVNSEFRAMECLPLPRRSTMTNTVDLLDKGGRLVMKSIDNSSQIVWEVESGRSNPYAWVVKGLEYWYIGHSCTHFLTSSIIPCQWNGRFIQAIDPFWPKYPLIGVECPSRKLSHRRSGSLGMKIESLKRIKSRRFKYYGNQVGSIKIDVHMFW